MRATGSHSSAGLQPLVINHQPLLSCIHSCSPHNVARLRIFACARRPTPPGEISQESPIKRLPGGTSVPSAITVPAAITLPAPIFAPFKTMAPIPIKQSDSTVHPCRITLCPTVTLSPTTRGCFSCSTCNTEPSWMLVRDPMLIQLQSPRATAHGHMLECSPTVTSPITTACGSTYADAAILGVFPPKLRTKTLHLRMKLRFRPPV